MESYIKKKKGYFLGEWEMKSHLYYFRHWGVVCFLFLICCLSPKVYADTKANDLVADGVGNTSGWVIDNQNWLFWAPAGIWGCDYKHWYDGAAEPMAPLPLNGWINHINFVKPPAAAWPTWPTVGNLPAPPAAPFVSATTFCGAGCSANSEWYIKYYNVPSLFGPRYFSEKWTKSAAFAGHVVSDAHCKTRITDPYILSRPTETEDDWTIGIHFALQGDLLTDDSSSAELECLYQIELDGGPLHDVFRLTIGDQSTGISLTYAPAVHFARDGVEITATQLISELSSYYVDPQHWLLDEDYGAELNQGFYFDAAYFVDGSYMAGTVYTSNATRDDEARVPEPTTLAMLALGTLALLRRPKSV
jgi:hypothetical protein